MSGHDAYVVGKPTVTEDGRHSFSRLDLKPVVPSRVPDANLNPATITAAITAFRSMVCLCFPTFKKCMI